MVAPPRPVPTTSTAAAGELIVPTPRRHRVTDPSPLIGLSPTQRPTVTKVVAQEAALTTLLPAAEQLLQGLAKVEAATSPANVWGSETRCSCPDGAVALGAVGAAEVVN